ncbi:MAG: lipid A biosynthesis acyltransferase [Myxococcales bacterium]|nr:hypothetical protein [Myxococcales bacterium]MCB9748850.1 lipid A biosynthesis acyltransferase [Myxococcales bacterium]
MTTNTGPTAPLTRAAAAAPAEAGDQAWMTTPEKGTVLGARLVVWTCRVLGRRGAGVLLRVIAFYYTLFARTARRASRDYLERSGLPSGFWASYRHVLAFARCALDRVFFVQGRFEPFEIHHHGLEHLRSASTSGGGAILLGAHMGSFEVMRSLAGEKALTINILVFWQNARMISSFLAELGADFSARVIAITPDDPSYIFAVRDAIERGEFVAMLGDRVGLGEKSVSAEFFGARARFPAGPYTLAAILKCPVYLTFGLFTAPNRYDLYCEPFGERLELPRGARTEALQSYAQRYAERLEHYCRQAPDNWFNFFDFWGGA